MKPYLFSLFILLSTTLTIKADVVVVAYMGDSQVVVVEGKTYKTLATLETGKNPHEVRISPDHRHAYVAAGKSITAVDLKKREVRATFDLGSYSAHDIRVSRDGKKNLGCVCRCTDSARTRLEHGKDSQNVSNKPARLLVC